VRCSAQQLRSLALRCSGSVQLASSVRAPAGGGPSVRARRAAGWAGAPTASAKPVERSQYVVVNGRQRRQFAAFRNIDERLALVGEGRNRDPRAYQDELGILLKEGDGASGKQGISWTGTRPSPRVKRAALVSPSMSSPVFALMRPPPTPARRHTMRGCPAGAPSSCRWSAARRGSNCRIPVAVGARDHRAYLPRPDMGVPYGQRPKHAKVGRRFGLSHPVRDDLGKVDGAAIDDLMLGISWADDRSCYCPRC
jgi:hypothetical protein